MRETAPFGWADLEELDERVLSRAARVIAIEDAVAGDRAPNTIGLRHDCDAGHSLATAVKMARWEQERGYRSTYYLLHTSPYWNYATFAEMVYEIAKCGHEIGIHSNALAESLRTGEDPDVILDTAIRRLRDLGYRVRGVAGHGDPFCNRDRGPGEGTFANDEQFLECRRPKEGEADRILVRGNIMRQLRPRPLADFGLEYEALFSSLPFPFRFSDSGGRWLTPGFDETAAKFARQTDVTRPAESHHDPAQLRLLIHPDWWAQAFTPARVAA